MLQVYYTILSLHDEPKHLYPVCSLFRDIMSKKSFWKERHARENLPFVEHNIASYLRTYYLIREFVNKETPLSCHLSELPFFPSFAHGEEYYPRAIKFRREQVPEAINRMLMHRCVYFYSSGKVLANYLPKKNNIDNMISSSEKVLGVKDPDHPSLDVSFRLQRTEFANYSFSLYIDLDDEEGGRVEVPVESTLIDLEQALSFYLQVQN